MESLNLEVNLERSVLDQVIKIETPSRDRLLDFIYGQDLVVYGIDVEQFFNSEEYRADSIAGLADMDGDPDALSLAVELASRHNIDRFNILINHVETTINNYNFGEAKFADINVEMCLKMSVLDEIKSDERFIGRLNKYCWPQMIGRDHRRLKLYWSTLKLCKNDEIISSCQSDLDFLASLVDINCLNFDYKRLSGQGCIFFR